MSTSQQESTPSDTSTPDEPAEQEADADRDDTAAALRRSGYALVGLGDVLRERLRALREADEPVEKAKDWSADQTRRARRILREGWQNLDSRGREAWPTLADQARRTGRATSRKFTEVARVVRWRRRLGGPPAVSEDLTLDELRELARAVDLSGRSQMNKSQLLDALRDELGPAYADVTVGELRERARRWEVEDYADLPPPELIAALRTEERQRTGGQEPSEEQQPSEDHG